MKRLTSIITSLVIAMGMTSCSKAEPTPETTIDPPPAAVKVVAVGGRQKITAYSAGKLTGWWTTVTKIEHDANTQTFSFIDEATQNVVRCSGDVLIEVANW